MTQKLLIYGALVLLSYAIPSGLGLTTVASEDRISPVGRQLVRQHILSPLHATNRPVHLRLGKQELRIPENYFFSLVGIGKENRAILLIALLPDLAPITAEIRDEFMKVRGWGKRVKILISVATHTERLIARIFAQQKKSNGPFEPPQNTYGLIHYNPVRTLQNEIFIDENNDDPSVFIKCDRKTKSNSPGCYGYFLIKNSLLKVSFGRTYLKDWKVIKKSVETLYRSFLS